MKYFPVFLALFLITGCENVQHVPGISSTPLSGANLLQRVTMEFHEGLSIMSDDRDYHATPTRLDFTPLSATSRITVRATGTAMVRAGMPESPVDITLYRDNIDVLSSESAGTRAYRLLSGALDFAFDPTYGIVDVQAPVSLEFNEKSTGAGRQVTYKVMIRTGDAPPLPNPPPRYQARWCFTGGTPLYSSITIEEYE